MVYSTTTQAILHATSTQINQGKLQYDYNIIKRSVKFNMSA